jgi:hypothetical protein
LEFIVKAHAVWGLGGSAELVFEFNPVEGFEFMWYVIDSVDYHRAYDALEECFDVFTVAKLMLLLNPTTAPALIAQKGASLLADWAMDKWSWWDEDDKIERSNDKNTLKEIAGKGTARMQDLIRCHPETLGLGLRLIMQTRDDGDYQAILNILLSTIMDKGKYSDGTDSYHKLRWTIRAMMGKGETAKDKGGALERGKDRLREFFVDADEKEDNTLSEYLKNV